jgi:hypothetical protein
VYLGNVVAMNEVKATEVPFRTSLVPIFQKTSSTSFQVLVTVSYEFHPKFKDSDIHHFSIKLIHYAKQFLGFDWVAVTGERTGMTEPGATGWQSLSKKAAKTSGFKHHGSTLFVDVDTSHAHMPPVWSKVSAANPHAVERPLMSGHYFKQNYKPRYFVGMSSEADTVMHCAGMHSSFDATQHSFRVNVHINTQEAGSAKPKDAERMKWSLMWFAVTGHEPLPTPEAQKATGTAFAMKFSARNSGSGSAWAYPKEYERRRMATVRSGGKEEGGWERPREGSRSLLEGVEAHKKGQLRIAVDAADKQFLAPVFVTSLARGVDQVPVALMGAATTIAPHATGFAMYIDTKLAPKHMSGTGIIDKSYAVNFGWRIDWLGVDVSMDCELGPWRDWEQQCSKQCGDGGTRKRTRAVIQQAKGTGTPCGKTVKTIPCQGKESKACVSCSLTALANLDVCATPAPTPAPTPSRADCVLSSWQDSSSATATADAWGECSATCGGGWQKQVRIVTQKMSGAGKPCGALERWQVCGMDIDCPDVLYPDRCAGATDSGLTQWKTYGTEAIYTTVTAGTASNCRAREGAGGPADRLTPGAVSGRRLEEGAMKDSDTTVPPVYIASLIVGRLGWKDVGEGTLSIAQVHENSFVAVVSAPVRCV